MTITIDLAALRDWETGAPDPDPNKDPAFDASEPNCPARLPVLPGPWAMSITELDTWHDDYDKREGKGLGLSNGERRHRAEIDRNIHLRHEARRHSAYP